MYIMLFFAWYKRDFVWDFITQLGCGAARYSDIASFINILNELFKILWQLPVPKWHSINGIIHICFDIYIKPPLCSSVIWSSSQEALWGMDKEVHRYSQISFLNLSFVLYACAWFLACFFVSTEWTQCSAPGR